MSVRYILAWLPLVLIAILMARYEIYGIESPLRQLLQDYNICAGRVWALPIGAGRV